MKQGEIQYDSLGRPICNICGRGYHKLISHVVQKHNITAIEYKKQFGYDVHKSIVSKSAKENARKNANRHKHKFIHDFLESGKKTRFKKGHKGRTADKLSEQSRKRIRKQIDNINNTKNGKRKSKGD